MNYLMTLPLCLWLLVELSYASVFTDTWAAHIEGGEDFAKSLAEKHGFTYLGQIMPDLYHLKHRSVVKRSAFPSPHHHSRLAEESQVLWLEQQVAKKRVKRDAEYNDPKWPRMWYLNRGGGLDMNVLGAWRDGYTGQGVVVSILDDGIEKDHPDLKINYDPEASYDVNGHDPDPQPRYDYTNENRHGTRCAGEVAAQANNEICSVGVAYNAKIGGVRMLDGDVTDAVESQSLSLAPQHIDVYSASWGPDDDGRTVDGPATLARRAFREGIEKGRAGKGSIFVWASGNGGRDSDSCNCDGYTNSIYTLSISSATENGKIPWYSEACSSTLATTYSSGSGGERQIVTTDLRKECTETHTGTSASAPLAAGIAALTLQAGPELTWRDMQHIVVLTARTANLRANDWVVNGVGRNVSHSFGFGLMDASAMVKLAKTWVNVPAQHRCQIYWMDPPRVIPAGQSVSVTLQSDGCRGNANQVVYLEHVQAILSLGAARRGDVQIFLTSPQGTKSTLLAPRARDSSTEGFTNWAFMTTHSWGEFSMGTWTLEIKNGPTSSTLKNWSLVLYGTQAAPYGSTSSSGSASDSAGRGDSDSAYHHTGGAGDTERGCEDEAKPYFYEGSCYEKCPDSFYVANVSREITVNSSAENVTSENETTTQQTTTEVFYQTCLPCSAGCLVCSDAATCSVCISNHGLVLRADNTTACRLSDSRLLAALAHAHLPALVWVLVSAAAVLVFVIVFSCLQALSARSHHYTKLGTSELQDDAESAGGKNNNTTAAFPPANGAVYKSDLEARENLLGGSEGDDSDLENEVFGLPLRDV